MQLVAVGELCQSGGCASRPSGVVAHRRVRGSFPGAALLEAVRRDGGERETFACAAALVMQPTLIALFPSFQSRSMSAALLYSLGCCSFWCNDEKTRCIQDANPIKKKARFLRCAQLGAGCMRRFFYIHLPSAACSFSPTQNAIFRSASEKEMGAQGNWYSSSLASKDAIGWWDSARAAAERQFYALSSINYLWRRVSSAVEGKSEKCILQANAWQYFYFSDCFGGNSLLSMNKLSARKVNFPCYCVTVKIDFLSKFCSNIWNIIISKRNWKFETNVFCVQLTARGAYFRKHSVLHCGIVCWLIKLQQ